MEVLNYKGFVENLKSNPVNEMISIQKTIPIDGCYNQYGWFTKPHQDGIMVIPCDLFNDRTPIFIATAWEYLSIIKIAEVFDARI